MWRADSRVARAAHGGALDACFPQGQIRFRLVVSALPGRSVELKTGSTFAAEVAAEV